MYEASTSTLRTIYRQDRTFSSSKFYSHSPLPSPMPRPSSNIDIENLSTTRLQENIPLCRQSSPAQWKLFHKSHSFRETSKWQRLAGTCNSENQSWACPSGAETRGVWEQGWSISQGDSSSQPAHPPDKRRSPWTKKRAAEFSVCGACSKIYSRLCDRSCRARGPFDIKLVWERGGRGEEMKKEKHTFSKNKYKSFSSPFFLRIQELIKGCLPRV